VRRLKDLHLLDSGTDVLFYVMRHARRGMDHELQEFVHKIFEDLRKESQRAGFNDGARWLQFQEADALAVDGDPLPAIPDDLNAMLHPKLAQKVEALAEHRQRKGRTRKRSSGGKT
jgi:DNA-binding cell septation regulator SpoVG